MTDIVDGIFFHDEGGAPADVLERLKSGRANPRLDNPFSPASEEIRRRIEKAKKLKEAAEIRVKEQTRKLEELEKMEAELASAYELFVETGKIEDSLIPSCDELIAKQDHASAEAACEAAEAAVAPGIERAIESGWEISGRRADDRYVYVILRHRRENFERVERAVATQIVERVRAAIENISEEHRACLPPRIVTQSRNPAAP